MKYEKNRQCEDEMKLRLRPGKRIECMKLVDNVCIKSGNPTDITKNCLKLEVVCIKSGNPTDITENLV